MPTSTASILASLDLSSETPGVYDGRWKRGKGATITSFNPATGKPIARVSGATRAQYDEVAAAAQAAFLRWREVPAPKRGELVRRIGNEFRTHKDALGALVTLEVGKILQEGLGEVQEAIDIADFAVGQSRMLYGLSLHSERPAHAMREQWHPLGPVGIVTAFNFPVAVWAWNSMLALVCGDACVWKPSEHAPLAAIAATKIAARVLEPEGFGALVGLCCGSVDEVATPLVDDHRLPLVSFTGSSAVGGRVGARVAARFGRALLELGGNNAIVLLEDADLDLALPAILFGAVGTAGQRCTTTRRLLVHRSLQKEVERRLVKAYAGIRIGDPLAKGTLCGPLISGAAVEAMQRALADARAEGGTLLCGGEPVAQKGALAGGHWVQPAIVRAKNSFRAVQRETFAPILYVIPFDTLEEAIALHNGVPQGLSSAVFTLNLRHAERFLSCAGSDCGIANVNIGTSGAEIGGAFGGEKETGGGRESGSDAWKAYMRRQTNTINWSRELPLAQGIVFG
ncbi:MAG: aldehyde dehydrogenase family protein [Planctomycetes bacterium]|nr:aldehyde dehydrogenase family protein [Planctomycetota bacterium]